MNSSIPGPIPEISAKNRPDNQARRWRSLVFWHLVIPLGFVALMLLYYPYRGVFEFDPDEGINLMKALLLRNGFPLYAQIWSDQPPVLTYLLAWLFRITGASVNASRGLILVFSAGLVWSAVQYLRLVWGRTHALLGFLLLLLVPMYLRLSLSVMIGLPSITFAMLALLALIAWHRTSRDRWLAASALVLSLSALTKIFTGFLVPVFAGGLLVSCYPLLARKNWRDGLRPAALWLAIFTGSTAVLFSVLVGWNHLDQVLLPHLLASQLDYYRENDNTLTLWYHLRQAWILLPLAVFGAVYIFLRRRWLGLYPLAWMAVAFALLMEHAPVWYHQALLVTVPAALLSAAGIGEAARDIAGAVRSRQLKPSLIIDFAMLVLFSAALVMQAPAAIKQFSPIPIFARDDNRPGAAEGRFLRRIEKFSPQTHWIVTNKPMYAFRSGIPIPPNLVVFTDKRLQTGYLPDDELRSTIQEYNPEIILLSLFDFPALDDILAQRYRLAHSRDGTRIYVRKDL